MPKGTAYAELAAKSAADLGAELKAAKEELFRLRFQAAIRQLENTGKIGEIKHRIAQITTAIHQQSLNANKGA